ncbi:hypothetical protein BGZ63DRAFT_374910 [Mariannaea sp. PMI_226]|nr:hypothetical protein BGZ63DRAFT_374910 [Mariannaea sp. PMI_226]
MSIPIEKRKFFFLLSDLRLHLCISLLCCLDSSNQELAFMKYLICAVPYCIEWPLDCLLCFFFFGVFLFCFFSLCTRETWHRDVRGMTIPAKKTNISCTMQRSASTCHVFRTPSQSSDGVGHEWFLNLCKNMYVYNMTESQHSRSTTSCSPPYPSPLHNSIRLPRSLSVAPACQGDHRKRQPNWLPRVR